jgi:cobalamin biosynthesis protein CobD/CbiB
MQKETYSASIPTWAYIVLGIAALDDVILWFTSPMLAIPLTLILLVVVLAFVFGGRSLLDKLFGAARQAAEGAVAGVTRSAASSMIRRNTD